MRHKSKTKSKKIAPKVLVVSGILLCIFGYATPKVGAAIVNIITPTDNENGADNEDNIVIVPDGEFYIRDGNDAEWTKVESTTASIEFNDNTLQFKFTATSNANYIVRVWVEIENETSFDLAKTSNVDWTSGLSWIAENNVIYTVVGWFEDTSGEFYLKMNIFAAIKTTPPSEPPPAPSEPSKPYEFPIDLNSIWNWFIIAGAVLTISGGVAWKVG